MTEILPKSVDRSSFGAGSEKSGNSEKNITILLHEKRPETKSGLGSSGPGYALKKAAVCPELPPSPDNRGCLYSMSRKSQDPIRSGGPKGQRAGRSEGPLPVRLSERSMLLTLEWS